MKRTLNVILTLVLSMVITATGSGLMLVYCGHSQTVAIDVDDLMSDGDDCHKQSQCMTVTVMKLAPTSQASFQSIDFDQFVAIVPDFILSSCDLLPAMTASNDVSHMARLWHSPPRGYLSLLTILRL